jgi:broad specificity phosphatase PhoE
VTILFLSRHGETDWNAEGRFQGHADVPLNDRGRAQARGLAHRLEATRIDAIYSSDLARSRETAEIVADGRGLPVTALKELREVDVGEWSGLTREEIEARWPGRSQTWKDEGHGWLEGETYEVMAARVVACLDRVAREHDGDRILYVGHGGTLRGVLAHARGITYVQYRRLHATIANCSLHRVAVRDGRFRALDG